MAKDKKVKAAEPKIANSAEKMKDTIKKEKSSKKVKQPTPEPSSDEDDDVEATSKSSDSSDSDDEMEDEKLAANGAALSEDDDDDSEDDSDDDEEPATNGGSKEGVSVTQGAAESDDDDDEDDEEEEEEEEKPSKKRKADSSASGTAKKTKFMVEGEEKEAVANLFVGQLSWNVDDDWLSRHFEGHGTILSARVITERDSGRSKGFGYVEFSSPEEAGSALEALQGSELDGRKLRIDFSTPRANAGTPQQKATDRSKKFGDVAKEPSSTIWVGNLPFDIDQSALGEYFQGYGSVNSVRLPTDRETGELKGFGYVELGSIDEAKAAFDGLNGTEINGRSIRLDYAGPRPERQDSFGGGRGGSRGGRGGRGGFNDRGGRGGRGGRGRGNDRGGRGGSTNRGGFGDFSGNKKTF